MKKFFILILCLFTLNANALDKETTFDKKLFDKHSEKFIAYIPEKQREIVIQSDQQTEINGVVYAKGNVLVEYLGKILKADTLIYDKTIKKINAEGNIALVVGDQIFKSSEIRIS